MPKRRAFYESPHLGGTFLSATGGTFLSVIRIFDIIVEFFNNSIAIGAIKSQNNCFLGSSYKKISLNILLIFAHLQINLFLKCIDVENNAYICNRICEIDFAGKM